MAWITWIGGIAVGMWALVVTMRYLRLRRKYRALRRRYGETLRQLELVRFDTQVSDIPGSTPPGLRESAMKSVHLNMEQQSVN